MGLAKCCDRCGNFTKLKYNDYSGYVSIGGKSAIQNLRNVEESMDLCPACMTELRGWLHIYDDEKEDING